MAGLYPGDVSLTLFRAAAIQIKAVRIVGDVSLSRRASMFRGAEHIFLDHPVKGVGLGTIVTVFPEVVLDSQRPRAHSNSELAWGHQNPDFADGEGE